MNKQLDDRAPNFGPQMGEIRIEDILPGVFVDEAIRDLAVSSLEGFKSEHGGSLPLKFRIEEFCFRREEQVCTVDSARKYLAWAGRDTETTRTVLGGLAVDDTPLVLRSHTMSYGVASPTFQITSPQQIQEHLDYLEGLQPASRLQEEFFGRIDPSDTVVQLLKNPYLQKGLFLCRPTFVYDADLRKELRAYHADSPQFIIGEAMRLDGMPPEFVGLRVVPLAEFAREKKLRMGSLFIYNPETARLEARDGFPLEAKWDIDGEWRGGDRPPLTGRTLNLEDSSSRLHDIAGNTRLTSSSIFLNAADVEFLGAVLPWQLPRISRFEDEVRGQDWIPQGFTSTHQFVVFPPQEVGRTDVNTQYYDFRPHTSHAEMDALTEGGTFAQLPTEQKILRYY